MHMGWPSLAEQLRYYIPGNENDRIVKSRFEDLLKEGSNSFKRSNLDRHFTGSAFLLNKDCSKALLTHHRKLDKWLQLGGHCDGNESTLHTAYLECQEESGISDIFVLQEHIFDLNIHFIPKHKETKEHYHYDVRYLLQTKSDEASITISDESIDLRWFTLNEMLQKNIDPDVSTLTKKLIKYKNSALQPTF